MIRSILLVEDLPFTRTMTRRILSAVGREDVVEAGDGKEAIELLDQPNEIDVILADISMPGVSGLRLLELIRAGKTPAARDIPFIVISGTVDDAIYNDLNELDATAITLKPVRKDDLSQILKRIEAELEPVEPDGSLLDVEIEINEAEQSPERTFESLTNQYKFDDLADRIRFLETVPDFEGLDVDSLRQLAERTSVLQVPERTEIDVSEFSGNRLLLIVTGEIELLQTGQFSRVGSQEHRTTLLEAGNLVGISSFMTLPGEGGAIQVRTTRATDLFSFDFTDSGSSPEVTVLRDNVRLSVGRTLAHRLNFSGKSLVDNLTERLAETSIKRTAGSFVIMMVATLAIYTLIVRTLLDLELTGPVRNITSVTMILLMLLPFLITIRKSPFRFSELGLTLYGWKIAVVEAIVFSLIFLIFLTGLKFLMVSEVTRAS